MNERVMPHNVDAEQAVLGSMFLSKYALEKSLEEMTKERFYLESHGKIFEAIKYLAEKGNPVDITTITAELDKRKTLGAVGGVEYLTEIINCVPTAANVDYYLKIVEEKFLRRTLIETATKIAGDGFASTDNIGDILDDAEKQMQNVIKNRMGTEFRTIQDVLFKAQADLEELSKQKGEITGIPTGFYDLDNSSKSA